MSDKQMERHEYHEYGCPKGDPYCICPGGPTVTMRPAKPVTREELDALAKRVQFLEAELSRALRGRGGGLP